MTRTGVLNYVRADGSINREFRPESEVFSENSLASLRGAPVTKLHTATEVSTKNWRKVAIGHVSEDVRRDGDFVVATVYIQDEEAIRQIEEGTLKELSCGYKARMVKADAEDYDEIQTDIIYNHVALGPVNWGRAGNDVALRLDSNDNVILETNEMAKKPEPEIKADETEEVVDPIREEITRLEGRLAALEAKLEAPAEEQAPKTDAADFDAAVKAAVETRLAVIKAYGADLASDKSNSDACKEILEKASPGIKLDSYDEATLVAMASLVASQQKATPAPAVKVVPAGDAPSEDSRSARLLKAFSKVSI